MLMCAILMTHNNKRRLSTRLLKSGIVNIKKRNRRWGWDHVQRTIYIFDNVMVVTKEGVVVKYVR